MIAAPAGPPVGAERIITLADIEAATETLSLQEKEALFRFLAARLRLPAPSLPKSANLAGGRRFDATAHRDWLKQTWGERRFTEKDVREMRAAQERGPE
jgi:hypothetical protein